MAKLVFVMNQSLDGYVDHMAFAPSPRPPLRLVANDRIEGMSSGWSTFRLDLVTLPLAEGLMRS